VPIPAVLRDELLEHLLRTSREGERLIFGPEGSEPFPVRQFQRAADAVWKKAGLQRITPHERRHTFASLMIAAGVNPKALSAFMGQSSITITLDRYGHLTPGSEEEAGGLLDGYLEAERERAEAQARGATGEQTGEQLASKVPAAH
jgi:integrase